MSSKKKLITSALPYVNNVPHLGNIIGCVLSADVYARICRALGEETLYICATDEYGTATENKAREEGVTPREVCDKYHTIHKKVYEYFNISFDYFGRTSSPEHSEITKEIYRELDESGMIEEKESEQTYCEHDNMFLADRYVEGVCPFCAYEEARGDQCDSCGKLLQPTELKEPKCKVCGNPPVRRMTKHLYIDLPKVEDRLGAFRDNAAEKSLWTNNANSVTKGWLENGLMARPITRDLKWGVSVPREGYEEKVFYVWFDAPIGYISATSSLLPDTWKEWWQSPETTELYQFMAKDNIPFHTVVFPATLMGTGRNWTLLHHINSTEYLNYENTKFSKSRNIGVFGTDVIESDVDVDLWRFYLLYNRPEKSDSNFCWDTFLEDINNSFIDNIGNLLNRVLVFFDRHFDGEIQDVVLSEKQLAFLEEIAKEGQNIVQQLEAVKLREGLKNILAIGKLGNRFFQEEEPWATIKTDPEVTRASLTVLIYLVRDLGIMLSAYMPNTGKRILDMLGGHEVDLKVLGDWKSMKGMKLSKPEILFKKLAPKLIEEYKTKFSGEQEDISDPLDAWKKIQLKVGEIKSVELHPSAERLYVEKIDCGEEEARTIVSGIVKYYAPEELVGKKVLVVANLAAADLRGVRSEGMLLAAEKRKKLEVITLDDVPVGTPITLDGVDAEGDFETISIDEFFECEISVADSFVQVDGKNLLVNGNPVKTEKVVNGKVG